MGDANAGVAGYTSLDDMMYLPVQQVRQDVPALIAIGNTIGRSISGNVATFQFAALAGSQAMGVIISMSF